jgi:hypothetical protein
VGAVDGAAEGADVEGAIEGEVVGSDEVGAVVGDVEMGKHRKASFSSSLSVP